MKNSYELAMERLEKKNGKNAALSGAQKKAIAEIDERMRAQIAELEIVLKPQLAVATDFESAEKLNDQLRRGIARAKAEAEEGKERVRAGR